MGEILLGNVREKFIDKEGEKSSERKKTQSPFDEHDYDCADEKNRKQIRAYGGCLGSWRRRRTW